MYLERGSFYQNINSNSPMIVWITNVKQNAVDYSITGYLYDNKTFKIHSVPYEKLGRVHFTINKGELGHWKKIK